jgi:hypothetical protein
MGSKTLRIALLLSASLAHAGCSAEQPAKNGSSTTVQIEPEQGEASMQIRINAGEHRFTARLDDSAAARDFAALLPLRLTLTDYASTEKIADLPRALSTEGAPAAITPVAGDLAYYAPWGNLAIFYRDGHHSPGLVRLGRIEAEAEQLASLAGPVVIETAPSVTELSR